MDILRTSFLFTASLLIGLVAWTGCDSTGSDASGTSGKMTLRLTDAPLDSATAVNVTIERIALVPGDVDDDADDNGDDDNGDDDEAEEDGELVDIYNPDTPQTINLLDYQDSSVTLADGADVPEGEYNQMRLFLTNDNSVVFESGREVALKTPSAQQSGYKVNIPGFEIDDNSDRIDLTLDFDASQSVVVRGPDSNPTGYLLKPVVRPENVQFNDGSLEEVEVEATGRIDAYTDSTVTVETVQFDVTSGTEFEDINTFDGLTSYSYASVEGGIADDGSFDALYLEAIEDEDKRFAFEGTLDAVPNDSTITILGADVFVNSSTEFDDDLSLGTLEIGSRYEVEFTKDADANRVATEIEAEDL